MFIAVPLAHGVNVDHIPEPPSNCVDTTGGGSICPVIVIDLHGRGSVSEDWLRSQLNIFFLDDVFDSSFLHRIVFIGAPSTGTSVEADAEALLDQVGTIWRRFLPTEHLHVGPHVIFNGQFSEVWRLYDDHQGAFVTPVLPYARLAPIISRKCFC